MAIALTILALVVLLKRLAAEPIPYPSSRPCTMFKLPVPAIGQVIDFGLPQVHSNIDASQVALELDNRTSTLRPLGNETVSETFVINVQLCIPSKGSRKSHLQIATHGIMFDSRYWDVALNSSEYSYVDAALAAGYSILTYDRLGTGKSEHPKNAKVTQATVEIDILRSISQMARDGNLLRHTSTLSNSTGFMDKDLKLSFAKVIHVGHSYGSLITSALLQFHGNLSDGAVITGYFKNKSFDMLAAPALGFGYALENDPVLFSDRSANYLVCSSPNALQVGFFSPKRDAATGVGGFEPEMLVYAYSIRETFSAAEFVSPNLLNIAGAPKFDKPIQFVVAELDYPVCKGDCRGIVTVPAAKQMYPKSPAVDVQFQKGNGHALTMHHKADLGYKATMEWLDKVGL